MERKKHTGAALLLNVILGVLALAGSAQAQHKLLGRVLDETRQPLAFAHVVLLSPADSTLKYFDVTDRQGAYKITQIKTGAYIMQFSYVTKRTLFADIVVPAAQGDTLTDRVLQPEPSQGVVVTAEYVPIQFKQDTVAFNAKAFKTKTGAAVEDLLKKIPGVEVDNAGNIKALGEDVKKVLVDGKEFFNADPKVATKNLPAIAIDKVEIFDKQSEDAEFTGVNDGVLDRTINLLLNEENKHGYFGNIEAGGGTAERYKTTGKLYRFSSTVQTAVLGMANNVNEFGFTGKEKMDFGEQIQGLNRTSAGGINLSLNTQGSNRYFLSYLGSSTRTDLRESKFTRSFLESGSYNQDEQREEDSRSTPHRINLGIRHRFNKTHKITVDGNAEIADQQLESLQSIRTFQQDTLINQLDNVTESQDNRMNASLQLTDILLLNNGSTQFKTKAALLRNESLSELMWTSRTTLFDPPATTVETPFRKDKSRRTRATLTPTWVQRLRPFWYIEASADLSRDDRSLSKAIDRDQGSIETAAGSSNRFTNQESRLQPGVVLRRSTGKSQFYTGVKASFIELEKTWESVDHGTAQYRYLLPSAEYSHSYQSGRHIRIRYFSQAVMPTPVQLLPVADNLNALAIYQGNLSLKPELRHTALVSWSVFDHFSFTSFFMHAMATYTRDKINQAQTVGDDLVTRITPVNVDNDFSLASYCYLSTPWRALGIKLNVAWQESWRRGSSLINNTENRENTWVHRLDVNLENRHKDFLHIRGGGKVQITKTDYSIARKLSNVYYSTTLYGDVQWTPTEKWNFELAADVVNYNAKSFDKAVQVPLLTGGISYHFLAGNKATLALTGYDLLNRYTHFQRSSTVNYLMETEKNTIGRYIMLSLKYRTGK